jgi:hypothetical protein
MANDELLLSDEQISFMKFKVGEKLVTQILENNPSVKLFGGAVRDKILHEHLKIDYCPRDYDFCTSFQSDYRTVIDFIQRKCGNVRRINEKDQNKKYATPQFTVTTLFVDLFAVPLTDQLTIKMDIVLFENPVNCDFDVNSLAMGTFGMELIDYTNENIYRKLRNVFDAIEKKQATLCYELSEEGKIRDQEKTCLNSRALRLIRRGWKVYGTWTSGEMIPDIKVSEVCKHCQHLDVTINCVTFESNITFQRCFQCFDLFWEPELVEVSISC